MKVDVTFGVPRAAAPPALAGDKTRSVVLLPSGELRFAKSDGAKPGQCRNCASCLGSKCAVRQAMGRAA